MSEGTRQAPGWTVHSVIRILIASYFIAFAFGLVAGTDMSNLLRAILPHEAGYIVTQGLVAALAVAIVVGWHRRPAALLLALMLFWSSYLHLLEAPGARVDGFWRDLALIGALMLTYADTEARGNDALAVFRQLPRGRDLRAANQPPPQQVKALSRRSVQRAFLVSPGGRAVSRLVRDGDKRKDIAEF